MSLVRFSSLFAGPSKAGSEINRGRKIVIDALVGVVAESLGAHTNRSLHRGVP